MIDKTVSDDLRLLVRSTASSGGSVIVFVTGRHSVTRPESILIILGGMKPA